MRIAVFGGSFDPVHNEHVTLALRAVESLRLDKLFVMPASKPPHKPGKELTDDIHRLEMCRRAFFGNEKITVSDYEIKKGGTSYTFETCRYFREQYPTADIFWIVGTDMLRDFPTWKNTQSILCDVTLAVCARNEEEGWLAKEKEDFFNRFSKTFEVIAYNGKDVSSTRIRVLLGAGENVDEFVPAPVVSYCKEHNLYVVEYAKEALLGLKESRKEHSFLVAETAMKKAVELKVSERKALVAGLFHDCAKNLTLESPLLKNFQLDEKYKDVPENVLHQFTGAYLAEKVFGVTDEEILDAIRYHTSGKSRMSTLGKIVYLADMVEKSRSYPGVEKLRATFHEKGEDALDRCLLMALSRTTEYLKEKGAEVYPLTLEAYHYYKQGEKSNGKSNDE